MLPKINQLNTDSLNKENILYAECKHKDFYFINKIKICNYCGEVLNIDEHINKEAK